MQRWWISDYHFGHSNIIKYCNRPFRDVNHMNMRLISDTNARVKEGDMLVHVGDFSVGHSRPTVKRWVDRINATVVNIEGNHDRNNGVKSIGSMLFTRIGAYRAFVSHVPWFYEKWFTAQARNYIAETCDFAICGHVHQAWEYEIAQIPTINVSVEVCNYRPLNDSEILAKFEKIKKTIPPINQFDMFKMEGEDDAKRIWRREGLETTTGESEEVGRMPAVEKSKEEDGGAESEGNQI